MKINNELKSQIRQVLKLSLPAILSQITTIVMQYIDSAMVGNLGANASAAIGLVSTSTWLLSGLTYGVTAGFSVRRTSNTATRSPSCTVTWVRNVPPCSSK